ncbi:acyl-CoA dehydrogenase family protein [Saccharopolyspora rosea]|uniref:hydrolase n=1 Tax=Saccharopolyspora rosea TaxID=524884 RepID=UPI0021DA1B08|nr:hydrolase [Saccharopolyspora rosea]
MDVLETGELGEVSRAADIAGRSAADGEVQRRLASDVVAALVDAGFARHFVPTRWGGTAGGFGDLLEAVAVVGERCASAAWVASLSAGVSRMGGYLPEEGQAELWAAGPDTLVVGALMPAGTVRRTSGGWLVSGKWPYISAVDHSDWAFVCGVDEDGGPDDTRYFALPRSAYRVEETWRTVGMRGTGSNTLVADDVVVPEHRSFRRGDVLEGVGAQSADACHHVPLRMVNGMLFTAPLLGAVRGALAPGAPFVGKLAGSPAGSPPRIALGRASGEVDAAQLLLERIAATADTGAASPSTIARSGRDCALAVELLVDAIDRLFRAGGTSAQAEGSALQRAWRDVHAGASHRVLRFDTAADGYAQSLLAE